MVTKSELKISENSTEMGIDDDYNEINKWEGCWDRIVWEKMRK